MGDVSQSEAKLSATTTNTDAWGIKAENASNST